MKRAKVLVTYEFLEQLLQLPDDVQIRHVVPEDQLIYHNQKLWLILAGDSLPVKDVSEGQIIPEAMILVKSNEQVPSLDIKIVEM